jgi:hypothetical protein
MPTYEELLAMGAKPGEATVPSQGGPAPLVTVQDPTGTGQPAPQQPDKVAPYGLSGMVTGQQQPQTGSVESIGRGLLQGATLNFSDEITGAIESLFSSKTYEQARDESRANNSQARQAHPFLYGGGELAAGIGTAFVPGLNVAKGASLGKSIAGMAAQGAASGLGSSDASLVGANRDIAGAAKDTAKGAVIGGVIGGVAHGIGRLVKGAPDKAIEDRAAAVVRGEGTKGSATVTARKLLARDGEGVDSALTEKFKSELANTDKPITLSKVMRAPAKEVLPIIEERAEQVGSKLDPIYEAFNKKEGGMSMHNFINHIDETVAELKGKPLNEKAIEAYLDVRDSALKSWAPELAEKLAGNSKAAAAGLDSPVFAHLDDVKVPYQDFRKMVTRLQARGSNVINPLNPGEAVQLKADLAKNLKEFLNADLERLADNHDDLTDAAKQIMAINREYSALANIQKAVEQRGWKENDGGHSTKGHLASAIGAGVGALAGSAIPIPVVGHALGAVVGAGAGMKAQAVATGGRMAATQALANAQQRMQSLAQRAATGDMKAKALLDMIQNSPDVAAKFAALSHESRNGQ